MNVRARWTGGQYSLFRCVLGAWVAVRFVGFALRAEEIAAGTGREAPFLPNLLDALASPSAAAAVLALGALLGVVLALGWRDRIAALLLAYLAACLVGRTADALPMGVLLLLHAGMPAAPYGSWDARGRSDPRGGWHHRGLLWLAAWLVLLVGLVNDPPLREGAWDLPSPGTLLVWALFLFDPAWVRPRPAPAPSLVFYDGACGLCHRTVRFLLAEDPDGQAFRYAPLQGEAFLRAVPEQRRAGLPDSIVVKTAGDALLVRSAAVVHMTMRLGGLWRLLGGVLWLLPRPLRDLGYECVARVRKRLFAAPEQACPLVPPDLAARFLS